LSLFYKEIDLNFKPYHSQ